MAKSERVGNAGCTKCGLRASSKNVAIRSVFPIWPDDRYALSVLENCVRISTTDHGEAFSIEGIKGDTEAERMANFVRAVQAYDPELKHLDKMFCGHEWKQDEGTASV